MMEAIVKEFVTIYGPLGLGWPLAVFLLYRVLKSHDQSLDVIRSNTEILTQIKVMFDERLPRKGG